MSLRQNAFIAILLIALTEIIGDWSPLPAGGRLWCLPAALLLLGLAYERLVVQRCRLELRVASSSPHFITSEIRVAAVPARRSVHRRIRA